jgi:hypothetical protein
MNPLIGMIDEFYSASHLDDQSRRDIIWRNIRALYLLTKKARAPGIRNRSRVAYERKQPVTIRCRQDDRRPLRELQSTGVTGRSASIDHV